MLIDCHTHAFHPKIVHKASDQLINHYGVRPLYTGTIEDLLEKIAFANLDGAVILCAATTASQVIPANNFALEVKRSCPNLCPFGSIHPDFADFEAELNRLYTEGIRGIKIHADFQGFRLDDKRLWPIFEAIGNRFYVMFHIGDTLPPDKNPSCPKKLAAILDDFPNLPVIAGHLGGWLYWRESLQYIVGRQVYLDTSSSVRYIEDDLLKKIIDKHPQELFLFGSDYPVFDPAEEIALIQKHCGFSDSRVEELLRAGEFLFDQS